MSAPADRTERLERMLVAKREQLLRELQRELGSRLTGDLSGRQDETIEIGDRSVSVLGEDLELGVLQLKRRTLRDIDEALGRLAAGSYWICDDCGAEIDERRLEILPFATRCVECKQRDEAAEKRVEPTGRGFRAGFRDLREIKGRFETDDDG